jgi:hypothetical protein
MELQEAKKLALKLMGMHLNDRWRFKFMNSKRAIGQCAQIRGVDAGWIKLSMHMIPVMNEAEVKNTILHEIAHALVGAHHGHNSIWRRKALEIGCNGNRTSNLSVANQMQYKYKATCPCCGNVSGMSRQPKRDYWCKCTGRTFRSEDKLVWVQQY